MRECISAKLAPSHDAMVNSQLSYVNEGTIHIPLVKKSHAGRGCAKRRVSGQQGCPTLLSQESCLFATFYLPQTVIPQGALSCSTIHIRHPQDACL